MEEDQKRSLDQIVDSIAQSKHGLKITGLSGSSAQYLLAASAVRSAVSAVLVTSEKKFEQSTEDIEFYIQNSPAGHTVLPFPGWGFAPYERLSPQMDISITRIKSLRSLAEGAGPFILVAPVTALMTRVMPKRMIVDSRLILQTDREQTPESIITFLLQSGYSEAGLVVNPGYFSTRGGILDLFSPNETTPLRIEFFGDTIQSMRTFDPLTQRSIAHIESVEIIPVSELILTKETLTHGLRWIRRRGAELATPVNRIRETIRELEGYRIPPGVHWSAGSFFGKLDTIFDYISNTSPFFIEEPDLVWEEAYRFAASTHDLYLRSLEKKEPVAPPQSVFLNADDIRDILSSRTIIELNPFRTTPDDHPINALTSDHGELRAKIGKDRRGETILTPLVKKITEVTGEGGTAALVCLTPSQAQRMKALLSSYGVDLETADTAFWPWLENRHRTGLIIGALREGFEDPARKLSVITEEEIFGIKAKIRRPRKQDTGEAIETATMLSPGDFVAHSRFGIGKFIGLVNLKVMGVTGDFVHLEYDGNDRLYVPVDKISLIHRYRGSNGEPPALDRLGSPSWERSKKKVKAEIFAMAQELAGLYASRRALPGHSFSAPGTDFAEFEALFAFEETPDQLSAVSDIITDMTSPTPMDRLIAGDVGYGKTEVAMRAAYIAAMDNKQVALIVPTTILAEQHFNTFRERFADHPVQVRMLSRFLSKKEQKEVIEGLARGTVDIVIGTHRLISKDIVFSNLGLLIVDEEHRFGVSHKEKIKKIKTQVDVLAMTATPIPRTLSMSIMGIRDISIINTPPPNRLSVKTYISDFDPEVIKEAVTREISRGGQVFFVHNRIKSMPAIRKYLERLIPEVRIGIAHGQMEEHELERVMLDFVDKHIDVLLSTAIIESGLDIPSANTIIVNRADTFGLAQLYQIRGRVGRSSVRAYAYFLIPSSLALTPDARKRLSVINEFSHLGSGIRIAEYDLEIRGAGNLLGADQSGHINAVGYEMYKEMVEQALDQIKGDTVPVEIQPDIQIPLTAYIPSGYISDSDIRLGLYRRIIGIKNTAHLNEIAAEITDRFGPPPIEVKNLIGLMDLRITARDSLITGIKYQKGIAALTFFEKARIDTDAIVSLVKEQPQTYAVSPEGVFRYRLGNAYGEELLHDLKNVLQRLARYVTL
ncbi:MAG: transcription-repair coupling factor [Deltaproteobacteria bacterium]|nr:transcription-repair coupling factor [Candidatus Zymogenaceae bacterium]